MNRGMVLMGGGWASPQLSAGRNSTPSPLARRYWSRAGSRWLGVTAQQSSGLTSFPLLPLTAFKKPYLALKPSLCRVLLDGFTLQLFRSRTVVLRVGLFAVWLNFVSCLETLCYSVV